MSVQAIFAPVFALVALTFVLLCWMGYARLTALQRREARIPDVALGEPNWPPRAMQAARAFDNQFQLPVLFYLLVIIAQATKLADFLFVTLSWLFVVTRFIHAGIHVTTNRVNQRFTVYLIGVIVLVAMWAIIAIRLLIADA